FPRPWKTGRRDDDHVVPGETPADERRIRTRIRANHDVVVLSDEIHVAVLGDDLELHVRIAPAELGGELAEHHVPHLHRYADPQSSARPERAFSETLSRLEDLRKQRMRPLVQRASLVRQAKRPGPALEEPNAEAFLERHDL